MAFGHRITEWEPILHDLLNAL